MRALAVQPDDDLRERIDRHLEERIDGVRGPSENEVLCELLRRGLTATDGGTTDAGTTDAGDGPAADDALSTDEREAIADRVDDVVDALYAADGAV
jgi:hypothetical protein